MATTTAERPLKFQLKLQDSISYPGTENVFLKLLAMMINNEIIF